VFKARVDMRTAEWPLPSNWRSGARARLKNCISGIKNNLTAR